MPIYKQCNFCGWCKRNYPDEIALTIYPVELRACPRCGDENSRETETDAVPRYKGAPVVATKIKTLF